MIEGEGEGEAAAGEDTFAVNTMNIKQLIVVARPGTESGASLAGRADEASAEEAAKVAGDVQLAREARAARGGPEPRGDEA